MKNVTRAFSFVISFVFVILSVLFFPVYATSGTNDFWEKSESAIVLTPESSLAVFGTDSLMVSYNYSVTGENNVEMYLTINNQESNYSAQLSGVAQEINGDGNLTYYNVPLEGNINIDGIGFNITACITAAENWDRMNAGIVLHNFTLASDPVVFGIGEALPNEIQESMMTSAANNNPTIVPMGEDDEYDATAGLENDPSVDAVALNRSWNSIANEMTVQIVPFMYQVRNYVIENWGYGGSGASIYPSRIRVGLSDSSEYFNIYGVNNLDSYNPPSSSTILLAILDALSIMGMPPSIVDTMYSEFTSEVDVHPGMDNFYVDFNFGAGQVCEGVMTHGVAVTFGLQANNGGGYGNITSYGEIAYHVSVNVPTSGAMSFILNSKEASRTASYSVN